MTLKGLSEKKAGILEGLMRPMRPMTQWEGTGSKCDLWALQVLDYIDTAYKWYLDQQSKMQSKNKTRYMYVSCLSNVMWIQYAQYCCTPVLVLDARKWFHRKLMKRKGAFEDTNCSSLQWSCGGRRERAEGWNCRFAPKVRRKNFSEPFLSWEGATTSQTSH